MKKVVIFSLVIFSFFGLLKIFSIIPFNRMAADDFSVAILTKQSIWMAISATFNTGNGRFVATFIQSVFVVLTGSGGIISFYTLATFSSLLFSFLFFYKKLLNTNFRNIEIYLLSAASFATLYFLTPNKVESWYWLTGSATYLWPIIFLTLTMAFIFENKRTRASYFFVIFFSFLSSACNETFGFLIVTISLLSFLITLVIKKKNSLLLTAFLSSALSFCVMYMAPGNNLRIESAASNPMSLWGSILYSIQEGPKHLLEILQNFWLFLSGLFLVLVYLFLEITDSLKIKGSVDVLLRNIFFIFLSPIFLSILYMLPAFKVLGRIQPDRSDISLSFIILFCIIGTAFYFAQVLNIENIEKYLIFKFAILFGAILLTISSFGFVSTLATDMFTAKNYSQAYDAMIKEFENSKRLGNKKDIIVSLPFPGLIAVTLDLAGHGGYKNQAMSEFYQIGKIISK